MTSVSQNLTYINVVEALVEREVEKQLEKLSPRVSRYIRPEAVITYALNRVKPLYACSETGETAQRAKAQEMYASNIAEAVTWGIRAVQNDPIRKFKPLPVQDDPTLEQKTLALQTIQSLLNDPSISWDGLEKLLQKKYTNDRFQKFSAPGMGASQAVEGNAKEEVSWEMYKNRRNERIANNPSLPRGTTGGAAGSLRLHS